MLDWKDMAKRLRKNQERREPIFNRTKKEWKTTQQTKKLPGGVYLFPAFW